MAIREQLTTEVWSTAVSAATFGDLERIRDLVRLYYGPREMIDLNTATAGDLDGVELLCGHGFEIVRYHEDRGLFTSLRQLDEVPGLAQKTDGVEADLYVEPAKAG